MIELLVALGAGLISFLSPCVLPLIPGYISYVSGNSLNELIERKKVNIIPTILFTVGFSIVFIIFGAASTFLGQFLLQNSFELRMDWYNVGGPGNMVILCLEIFETIFSTSKTASGYPVQPLNNTDIHPAL